jgi:Kef-type K+ transport system membrane component KefB
MISRGEVGLIVAQVGLFEGIITSNVYTMVVIMAAVTTVITPLWLTNSCIKRKRERETRKARKLNRILI